MRSLKRYYGARFIHCDFYKSEDCCKRIPCSKTYNDGAVFIQKSHDLQFEVPLAKRTKYLIQVRHIVPQTISNFELWISNPGNKGKDTKDQFFFFAIRWLDYYRGFVKKWIQDQPRIPHVLTVYENMIQEPQAELAKVLRFLTPDEPIDRQRLDGVFREEHPEVKHDVRAFRHFDKDFLWFLQEKARDEIRALGVELRF